MEEKLLIEAKNLKKTFKISERKRGLPGRIANLFVKKFKTKVAVDEISFSINEGESVGFIGPNGAGKSTTIKMLSGILYPTEGELIVDGLIPYKQRKKYVSKIGVVFGQKSQLQWDLPVIDSFELLRRIYSISKEEYEKKLKEFIEILDMSSFINQQVRQLSLGQRMRADIAAALLHSPKIVFLDEPTIGLDVVVKEKIRDFIRFINKEYKVTIIFTTHDLKDIEQTCERLIIIDKGKKIYDGMLEEIKEKYNDNRELIVQFEEECSIKEFNDIKIKNLPNNKKCIFFDLKKISTKDLISKLMKDYEIKDFTILDTNIDEIISKIYQEGIN